MRYIRAVVVPILLLAAVCMLAWLQIGVEEVAHFDFIWDVLLGAVLGAGLALLPAMAGFAVRKNALTGMLWVCGFLSLLLIFYQYMTLVTSLQVEALSILASPDTRMRVVEGVILGYCSFVAGRGKI